MNAEHPSAAFTTWPVTVNISPPTWPHGVKTHPGSPAICNTEGPLRCHASCFPPSLKLRRTREARKRANAPWRNGDPVKPGIRLHVFAGDPASPVAVSIYSTPRRACGRSPHISAEADKCGHYVGDRPHTRRPLTPHAPRVPRKESLSPARAQSAGKHNEGYATPLLAESAPFAPGVA